MRREEGMMRKKWVTIYVELRDECICVYNNEADRVSIFDKGHLELSSAKIMSGWNPDRMRHVFVRQQGSTALE